MSLNTTLKSYLIESLRARKYFRTALQDKKEIDNGKYKRSISPRPARRAGFREWSHLSLEVRTARSPLRGRDCSDDLHADLWQSLCRVSGSALHTAAPGERRRGRLLHTPGETRHPGRGPPARGGAGGISKGPA